MPGWSSYADEEVPTQEPLEDSSVFSTITWDQMEELETKLPASHLVSSKYLRWIKKKVGE